jgi:hypothetical protein
MKVQAKVEEYVQVRRIRTVEVDLEEEIVKQKIHGRETMIFDMDEEGDKDLINIVCAMVDKGEFVELEKGKEEELQVMCIMRMKILKVT